MCDFVKECALLPQAQLFAKREHEGVVQMLEVSFTSHCFAIVFVMIVSC